MSSLPFLRKKNDAGIAGVMVQHRSPDNDGEEHKDQEYQPEAGLRACAKDLMDAINSGDHSKVAQALRAAFEILDSEPHVEGEHIEDKEENE